MSKAVPLDHEFNKDKFADLLMQAKGDRSQTQFAQECGLSVSHLNRYYNLKKDLPPVPSTLRKIAQNAKNDVTYEDLLEAAGYDSEKNYTGRKGDVYERQMTERLCISELVKCLSRSAFKWNNPVFEENSRFDIEIDIDDSDVLEHWCFETRYMNGDPRDISLFSRFYGELCCQILPPKTKVSLVIWSAATFDIIKNFPPVMLPIYFSVILFDPDDDKIVNEEYLPTALDLPDDLKTVFILERKD